MHLAVTGLIFLVALADLFFTRESRLLPLLLLFLGAKAQADYAAAKLLKTGVNYLGRAMPSWRGAGEDQPVPAPMAPFHRLGELKILSLAEARQQRQQAEAGMAPSPRWVKKAKTDRFRKPAFTGAPHEVLGIDENAATGQIVGAFRHWIKEFHPDRSGKESTDASRKLYAAKVELLNARKLKRKAA